MPLPLSTRSSFEKITASVLVSPSAVKVPVTERVFSLPAAVVTKHLSAETTYIAGLSVLVTVTPSSTSCTLSLSPSVSTRTVQFSALPLMTYTPASVMLIVLPSATVSFCASEVSASCFRSRSENISAVSISSAEPEDAVGVILVLPSAASGVLSAACP